MRSVLVSAVSIVSVFFVSGCERIEPGQDALYLPEGDAAKGAEHFVSLGCVSCHTVIGADLPEPGDAREVRVVLGSTTGRDMSYNRLVTSIVNPSHRLSPRYRREKVSEDGESLMRTYNDVMTVTELSNLVAFLQAHYTKVDRPGYKYPVYDYGSDEEAGDE